MIRRHAVPLGLAAAILLLAMAIGMIPDGAMVLGIVIVAVLALIGLGFVAFLFMVLR